MWLVVAPLLVRLLVLLVVSSLLDDEVGLESPSTFPEEWGTTPVLSTPVLSELWLLSDHALRTEFSPLDSMGGWHTPSPLACPNVVRRHSGPLPLDLASN